MNLMQNDLFGKIWVRGNGIAEDQIESRYLKAF